MTGPTSSLRILHVASSYPLNRADVTAPFMHELLRAQARRGHRISVLLPKSQGLVEGNRDGVSVIGFDYPWRDKRPWGYGQSLEADGRIRRSTLAVAPLALFSMIRAVRRELRRNSPDVVHLHWVLPQGAVALALPRHVPLVISAHGADARFVRGGLAPLTRRILGRADVLVAASSKILESFTSIHPDGRNKSEVIPHGAESELFRVTDRSIARASLEVDPDLKIVLGVGRLVRKKGFDVLVKALDHIPNPAVQLVIIGDGPERDNLEELAHQCRLRLLGKLNRAEVATWFAAADVVAIPSLHFDLDVDSGPVVLMESLASGRPVVSTPIGMALDVIQNDVNGYLADVNDPVSLAEGISRAFDSSERLGDAARRSFEDIGDWSRVAADLERVYADATTHRSERIRKRSLD